MYSNCDKKKIYWLINQYAMGNIDADIFCDEYHECYDLELNLDTLTEMESRLFSELSTIAGRFTSFQEDLEKYPGTYFDEKQLKEKINQIKKNLGF
jgi:hypothetical protein